MKTMQNPACISKLVMSVLAAWLALVLVLGALGVFVTSPGRPPLPILLGVALPMITFLAAFWLSPAFHDFVMTFDLRLAAGIQAWRFVGLGFLALYAHGVLPGEFAWSAGIGDMVVGIAAPWVMLALLRDPGFVASKRFVAWNIFGVLDLVAALASGGVNSVLARGTPGEVTTGPMAQLPLILIPAYFVPLFLMLHVSALLQARGARLGGQIPAAVPAACLLGAQPPP